MKQIKWFKRNFDFAFEQNIFPSLIERLDGTPVRLKSRMAEIPTEFLEVQLDNTWSIKENIGHLIDLEPLWQGRLDDILAHKEYLRPTDLDNKKTDRAQHNSVAMDDLLVQFTRLRELTLNKLFQLKEEEIYKAALHPRLEKPMRTMDLFLFVAEHDDHHLTRIREIEAALSKK